MGTKVRAWLRMKPITGDYPMPTSEIAYLAQSKLIDDVVAYGVTIMGDGSLIQDWYIDLPWSRELPGQARAAGQRYVCFTSPPSVTALQDFLDTPAVWQTAADGVVSLALSRWDAPWDGVMWDATDVDTDHIAKENDFMALFSSTVRAAGLPFEIAYRGVRQEDESFSLSLDVIRDSADTFDYYMYGFWGGVHSLGPYHWARASIENALSHGLDKGKMHLGIPLYSRYWPLAGYGEQHNITHSQVLDLVYGAGATIAWIEGEAEGIIREKYADLGDGARIWIQDGATVRARLDLVDEYDLEGAMLFCPGFSNGSEWQAIGKWNMAAKGWVTPEVLNYKPGQRPAQQLTRRKRR